MNDIHAFFVYGTLQRGHCRERFWPCTPLSIHAATTLGSLRDLGPYPGLLEGSDTIGGELWLLRPEDVPRTLAMLDEVEGTTGCDDEWYARRVVQCRTDDGTIHRAWCYFFARPDKIISLPVVNPDSDGACRWRQSM